MRGLSVRGARRLTWRTHPCELPPSRGEKCGLEWWGLLPGNAGAERESFLDPHKQTAYI